MNKGYNYGISESEVMEDKSLPYVSNFTDIKTPKTIEEFRENLLKYYVSYDRFVDVGENDKGLNSINVDEIESMDDLGFYDGFRWNGSDSHCPTLMLTPSVVQIRDWDEWVDENYMKKMGMEELCVQWWVRPENNIIVDISKSDTYKYVNLCRKYQKGVYFKNIFQEGNDLFRDFYQKTLGKFGRGEWKYDDEGNRLMKEVV